MKPSDIRLSTCIPLGKYIWIVRPFPNRTLICDEDLTKKQKICNISQPVVDRSGEIIFSWSLAADETSQPIFILRTPPDVGAGETIRLDLSDGSALVVPVRECDARVCLAYQQIDPRLRAAISKAKAIRISFNREASSAAVSFHAPLTVSPFPSRNLSLGPMDGIRVVKGGNFLLRVSAIHRERLSATSTMLIRMVDKNWLISLEVLPSVPPARAAGTHAPEHPSVFAHDRA